MNKFDKRYLSCVFLGYSKSLKETFVIINIPIGAYISRNVFYEDHFAFASSSQVITMTEVGYCSGI